MRTRCKFKVVGVENVEGMIFQKIYAKDLSPESFAELPGVIYTDTYSNDPAKNNQQYKSVATGKYMQNIRLVAQYDPTIPEDKRFMEATPTGELKIFLNNPAVVGNIQLGEYYYVDLVPCD